MTTQPAADWRKRARAGVPIERIAADANVTAQTIRDHIATPVGDGRALAPGDEVHLDGLRARWRFTGDITADGAFSFQRTTTGRVRYIRPERVTTIHRTRSH